MAELWLQRSCVSIALRWMQYICCGATEQKGEADRGTKLKFSDLRRTSNRNQRARTEAPDKSARD